MKERFGALQLQVGNRFNSNIVPKNGTHKSDKINHGLGLKSVQEIVRRHHGKMWIVPEKDWFEINIILYDSNPGKTARFRKVYIKATPHNYLCGVAFSLHDSQFFLKGIVQQQLLVFFRCQTGIGFEVMHKVRLIKISQICGNFVRERPLC